MKRLLEEMEKNQELKAKIEELDKSSESTPKDYIQVAAEYGIELKEEDFKPAQGELADDELDAVAGGDACTCPIGGGGASSKSDNTCACVLGGGGEYTDGSCRCACVLVGGGDGKSYTTIQL